MNDMRNEFKYEDDGPKLPDEFARRLTDANWDRQMAGQILAARGQAQKKVRLALGGGLSVAAAVLFAIMLVPASDSERPVSSSQARPESRSQSGLMPVAGFSSAKSRNGSEDSAGSESRRDPAAPGAELESGAPMNQLIDQGSELVVDDVIDDAMQDRMLLTGTGASQSE